MPSGLLNTILGIIGTALISWIAFTVKSRTGNKVIIQKSKETSLIKISENVQDKLSISYDGKPVKTLKLYEYTVTNKGYEDISNFEIFLEVTSKPSSRVMEILIDDPKIRMRPQAVNDENKVAVLLKREYLNSDKRDKSDFLTIQLFSDSPLEVMFKGGGKGWVAKFIAINKKPKFLAKAVSCLIIIVGLVVLAKIEELQPYSPIFMLLIILTLMFGIGFVMSYFQDSKEG